MDCPSECAEPSDRILALREDSVESMCSPHTMYGEQSKEHTTGVALSLLCAVSWRGGIAVDKFAQFVDSASMCSPPAAEFTNMC